MPREKDLEVYLQDIIDASEKILRYTEDMELKEFRSDEKTKDAVLRNLEVIGEAAKKLPTDFREKRSDVNWRAIAGMRDKLIHEYFGVSSEIVWETVKHDIPNLKKFVEEIVESSSGN